MSSFPPPRTNWTAIIGVALTAASMYAFGIRYIVRLNEADETRKEQIRILQNEVRALQNDTSDREIAKDVAVIRERVDWLVKAEEKRVTQQQKRGR